MAAAISDVQKWSGGHTDSILCLDCSDSGVVVSGSENGECTLWTADGKVLKTISKSEDSVTAVCFSQRKPTKFFISSGNKISEHDCQNLSEPVWTCEFNSEEVNQLALNSNEELLAACDDTGQVKVINLRERKLHRTLRKHSNICTSVKFRKKKQWELVSGSMDECVVQWECGRGRVMTILDMKDFVKESMPGNAYLVNPPLVHSVDISGNDRLLACGLENATVELFEFQGKKGITEIGCLKGHTQGVSQVHFPRFKSTDCLVSAGNDGKIILWDVSGNSAASPCKAEDREAGSSAGAMVEKFGKLSVIDHGDKINWITSMNTGNKEFVLVADQTEFISQYRIC
ncbi:WD repeat-containing protein 53-like [Ptychodera flava]|uniref:WD repeat-containing protein 53-like n=1 Tax=Ptychodera flava TaxID=63121 RepID=UPI00396A54A1